MQISASKKAEQGEAAFAPGNASAGESDWRSQSTSSLSSRCVPSVMQDVFIHQQGSLLLRGRGNAAPARSLVPSLFQGPANRGRMVVFRVRQHDDLHCLYRVRTEAPACEPALPQFALPGLNGWQLLVQHLVWIADRAGWKNGGKRIRRRRDLFYFGLG